MGRDRHSVRSDSPKLILTHAPGSEASLPRPRQRVSARTRLRRGDHAAVVATAGVAAVVTRADVALVLPGVVVLAVAERRAHRLLSAARGGVGHDGRSGDEAGS